MCLCSGFFGCSGKEAQSDPAVTPENPGCRELLGNTKSCPSWLDWTEHRSGHSWRLHRLSVSTQFEIKKGSQGMLACLVANGRQKLKQKQTYRHSNSHPSSLQSRGEKQTRRNKTSHTPSSSDTVGQTRQTEITRCLRGWRGLRVTREAQVQINLLV